MTVPPSARRGARSGALACTAPLLLLLCLTSASANYDGYVNATTSATFGATAGAPDHDTSSGISRHSSEFSLSVIYAARQTGATQGVVPVAIARSCRMHNLSAEPKPNHDCD